jgi:hypothetical protein
MLPPLCKRLNRVQEIALRLFVPIDNGLPWILWKNCILYDELMQVVPQEVCAGVASVPIEDTKETTLGPVCDILLGWRLHDIEDDGHTVLVVVTDDTLVRVGSISHYVTVFANAAFCRLPAREV